jgi:hypothetical protein
MSSLSLTPGGIETESAFHPSTIVPTYRQAGQAELLVFDPEAPFGLSYIRPELMSKAGSKTDPKIMFALVELVFFS